MAAWFQNQLKVAETLLDAVDKTVSKTIVKDDSDGVTSADGAGPDAPPRRQRRTSSVTEDAPLDSTTPTTSTSAFARLPAGSSIPFGGSADPSPSGTPTARSQSRGAPQPAPTPTPNPTTADRTQHQPAPSPSPASTAPPPPTDPSPPTPPPPTSPPASPARHSPTAPPQHAPSQPVPTPTPTPPLIATTATPISTAPPPPHPTRLTSLSPSTSYQDLSDPNAHQASTARDMRLSRLAENLKKRLEESRAENQQLEEMLAAAEQQAGEYKARASTAQAQLDAMLEEKSTAEDVYQAAVTAKDVQVQRMRLALEEAQGQVAALQGTVATLEESKRLVMESKGELEGSILQALRNDVRVAEQQLDRERAAHQASKAQAAARQIELEGHLTDNATALAGMQHKLEEAGTKSRAFEEQLAVLQVRAASLEQQLKASQAAAAKLAAAAAAASNADPDAPGSPTGDSRGGVGMSGVEAEALRREVQRQRVELQRAERGRRAAEAEAARLAEQLTAAREEGPTPLSPAAKSAEARVKEMGEMLYIKQTQLEKLAADKAAQQLVLERELVAAREDSVRLRVQLQRYQDASREGPHDVIPMDALGEPYQRLVRHNRIGGAVRTAATFLDRTASSAAHMIRQYPLVRLGAFAYAAVLHLYVWYLTMRMQRMAMGLEAQHAGQLHGVGGLPHQHRLP